MSSFTDINSHLNLHYICVFESINKNTVPARVVQLLKNGIIFLAPGGWYSIVTTIKNSINR